MSYFIGAIIAITLLILFFKYMNKPKVFKNVKLNEIQEYIESLLQHEVGSILFIRHQKSDVFIQIALYEDGKSNEVLHFAIPYASWSKLHYDKIKKAFSNASINFTQTETNEKNIPYFLEVNIDVSYDNQHLNKVAEIIDLITTSLGLGKDEFYNLHYSGYLKEVLSSKSNRGKE